MTQQLPRFDTRINKPMSPEQLNQVVEAILEGKYSWACVLILRFTGYNPLDYIPYRTHNRLLKENCQFGSSSRQTTDRLKISNQSETASATRSAREGLIKLKDLGYVEVIDKEPTRVRGGFSMSGWAALRNFFIK
jgi:hypothetical protein